MLSLPGVNPAFGCTLVCVCMCPCVHLSAANLAYYWTYHPNIFCAHLELYVQGNLMLAVIHIFLKNNWLLTDSLPRQLQATDIHKKVWSPLKLGTI